MHQQSGVLHACPEDAVDASTTVKRGLYPVKHISLSNDI